MKRLFYTLLALHSSLFTLPALAAGDGDRPVIFEELPATAQKLIGDYFPDVKVTLATVDREFLDTTWDVILADGTRIEFDTRGEWKEIECRVGFVPEGILPPRIASFLAEHHPGARVKEIDRDREGYELNLDNRRELTFDSRGNFRRYDD